MKSMPANRTTIAAVSGLTGASLGIAAMLQIHPFDAVPTPQLIPFLLVAGVGFVSGAALGAAASAYRTEAEYRTKNVRALTVILAPLILTSWGQVHGFHYGIGRRCPAEAEGRVVGVPSAADSMFTYTYRFTAGDAEFHGGGRGDRPSVDTPVLVRFDPSEPRKNYGIVAGRRDVGLFWQIASVVAALVVGVYWNRFRRKPIVVCLVLCACAFIGGPGRGNAVAGYEPMRNYLENHRSGGI
jgi:hypothetical protein